MVRNNRHKGPWSHRVLIFSFTLALSVLTYWLIGFVTNDIRLFNDPDYTALEKTMLDEQLINQQIKLKKALSSVQVDVTAEKERQISIEKSTQASKLTMEQMLEFQKASLEKDIKPTTEQKNALTEAQSIFLSNQRQFQNLNIKIVSLQEKLRKLNTDNQQLESEIEQAKIPIQKEFQLQAEEHRLQVAMLLTGIMIPLLILVWMLVRIMRAGEYRFLSYALAGATSIRFVQLMFEYFPLEIFKYLMILAGILVVIYILIRLIKMMNHPQKEWLLKQYREAYEKFRCPECDYPIRMGPLRFAAFGRRGINQRFPFITNENDSKLEPYTCPVCSTRLFDKCSECGNIRHSLLPVCSECGTANNLIPTGS